MYNNRVFEVFKKDFDTKKDASNYIINLIYNSIPKQTIENIIKNAYYIYQPLVTTNNNKAKKSKYDEVKLKQLCCYDEDENTFYIKENDYFYILARFNKLSKKNSISIPRLQDIKITDEQIKIAKSYENNIIAKQVKKVLKNGLKCNKNNFDEICDYVTLACYEDFVKYKSWSYFTKMAIIDTVKNDVFLLRFDCEIVKDSCLKCAEDTEYFIRQTF